MTTARTKRIKHSPPPGDWPTADEARRSLLFSPIRINGIVLEQRTWVPAMVPWRATEEGFVTPAVLAWYRRFAEGRPGAIVVEATGIRDIPSGPLLRIGHDRFLPGLRELVETVRRASDRHTRFLIQIIDFLTIRRRPPKEKFLRRFLEITHEHRRRLVGATGEPEWEEADEAAIREKLLSIGHEELRSILTSREWESLEYGYRERVWDMHLPHVRDLPKILPGLFAGAAERARRAGFDGVELHYAHAYTMASFLSRLNDRTDGYGGTPENRVRLPLEVYGAVRERVGSDYVVGCRFLGDEVIEGGSRIEDAVYYGVRFARAGMDYLSISKGGKFEDGKQPKVGEAVYPYTGPSGHECMPTVHIDERGPFGRNVPLAAAIRRAIHEDGHPIPVVTSGGICSFSQAEAILRCGEADIVGAARQSLADPDWFLKMVTGHGDEIRRCLFTNYCEALDQKHVEVTCQLWDREFEPDEDVLRSSDRKRRLVAPPWRPRPVPR